MAQIAGSVEIYPEFHTPYTQVLDNMERQDPLYKPHTNPSHWDVQNSWTKVTKFMLN